MFLRLTLILVAVLFLAQLWSAALHFQDRGQVLHHTAGLNSAERIAGIVRLLDPMAPEERVRAVTALDVPALRITLDQAVWPQKASSSNPEHAQLLQQLLRSYLGNGRPIQVMVRQTPLLMPQPEYVLHVHSLDDSQDQMASKEQRKTSDVSILPPRGVSFLAQVKLEDGAWVVFDHRVPEEVFGWSHKLLWSLFVLLISTVAVALVAVRWVTNPLATVARAADELGRDIQRAPLIEKGSIEVRRAARAFNNMQARIIRSLQDRSRIMAAISHDLKTPITRLRLRSEMLEDEALRDKYLSDLKEMEIMVQGTLDFMRGMDSEEPIQQIDFNALLESLQADAEDLGHDIRAEGEVLSPYAGKPLELKRCLSNLLSNAIKYGFSVVVYIEDNADVLRIRVTDDGPGIPDQQLEQVFEPFYRLEASRSRETGGTGLGLSIARNIVRAHGGELVLKNRPKGGLEAILSLPR
jgi:signal transduction histidine kinase